MSGRKRNGFLVVSIVAMATLLAAGVFGQSIQKENVYRYLSVFTEVFSLVKSSYVDEVQTNKLIDGAFSGITDAVDEYSYYVPPEQLAEFRAVPKSELSGIGVSATKRFGYGYVIAPIAGSAAHDAGLESGDFIEKINDVSTQTMTLWQIEATLRNPSKPVKLEVLRGGMTRHVTLTVAPRAFAPAAPSVTYHGDVAVLSIPYFGESTAKQVADAVAGVTNRRAAKLLIDIRGSAGGSFEEAIKTADAFLANGTIAGLQGKRLDAKTWKADSQSLFTGEVGVLIDPSVAGAAELFAAALDGNERAKLIGITTYGRSIQQKVIELSTGGALYMTIGQYTAPSGKTIREHGVRPDVAVDITSTLDEKGERRHDVDPIMNKALALFGAPAALKEAA